MMGRLGLGRFYPGLVWLTGSWRESREGPIGCEAKRARLVHVAAFSKCAKSFDETARSRHRPAQILNIQAFLTLYAPIYIAATGTISLYMMTYLLRKVPKHAYINSTSSLFFVPSRPHLSISDFPIHRRSKQCDF